MGRDLRIPIDGTLWTTHDERARQDFAALVERVESHSPTRLALQVAVSEYRELIVEAVIAKLEALTQTISTKLPDDPSTLETIAAINDRLFGDLKFWGDQNEPDNPKNCYLNDVLNRRIGLPIALSVTYVDVADRLSVSAFVVAIPGLHLVRVPVSNVEDVFVDVYHGGQLLGHAELADLVRRMTGGRYDWGDSRPEDVGNRELLTGLLTDLKGAYAKRADYRRVLRVHNYLLTLNPDSKRELRDRAGVWEQLGRPAEALADYREYLVRDPKAADREQIHVKISSLE